MILALVVLLPACGDDDDPADVADAQNGLADASMRDGAEPFDGAIGPDATNASLPFVDSFDGAALDPGYQVLHGNATSALDVAGGQLRLTTDGETVWWMAQNNAVFIYRTVAAPDFAITTTVRSRSASAPGSAIDSGYHYAGPMVRLPASDPTGPQHFAFVAVGYQNGCDGGASSCIESKSTVDNTPSIDRLQLGTTDAQLRLCKVGSAITAYHRNADGSGSWTLRDSWSRPDLSGSLQVGLMAFSFNVSGDQLRVLYDDLAIRLVANAADCIAP